MGIMGACELMQQADITLDSCHKFGFRPGFSKPKLVQGTDPIRITIENVDKFLHDKFLKFKVATSCSLKD